MSDAVFFRLLNEDVEDKSVSLVNQLSAFNNSAWVKEVFTVADAGRFRQIPGSTFAYWVSSRVLDLFREFPLYESDDRSIRIGLSTSDDFRFLRLCHEVHPSDINYQWFLFAKGGRYSPYYSDIHLTINWKNDGKELKEWVVSNPTDPRTTHWSRRIANPDFYFRPGLTWPLRTTSGISFRPMPKHCLFGHKGPAIFTSQDDTDRLLVLLAISNSRIFEELIKLQLGAATAAARSYEVGVIQRTPVPQELDERLVPLAQRAHDLQRENYVYDEITHVFRLPAFVEWRRDSLVDASIALEEQAENRRQELMRLQAEIDEIVFDLYGLDKEYHQLVMREMGTNPVEDQEELDEDDEETLPEDLRERVQNLLMWCVGLAFGRWDVRKALDFSLISPLPGPFDPLPRCAPGALMNAEGLPAEHDDLPDYYPLPVAWDGVLVDDPEQENNPASDDIVARVRGVLTLLWGDQADAIEWEICGILDVRDLRDYFRNPGKGFFNFHIKRYSKSRRKAPIYWLLQSDKRGIGVWLYYPRITENTLFATENILHTLLQREQYRLEERKSGLEALSGAERKRREREIDAQTRLVEEIAAFHRAVLRLANLKLPPDHNDGVLISIAPLYELVPWKEASKMWNKLINGDYTWSRMSEQMQRRGLINV